MALFITNDLCLRLLNIVLTGCADKGLEKRDNHQKRRKDMKKAALPLNQDQLYSIFEILRIVLRNKCNLHTVKGTAGMQQSTVINLRFANRLCQIIQYSYLPKEDEAGERSDTLALKGFRVATSDKERD